jgi:site-specific DNA-methyltransferase (adenine-specific)
MGDLSFPWKPDFEEIYVNGNGFIGHRGSSVLCFNSRIDSGRHHPTEKPLELMTELISKTIGTILDPFMGSGTTLRATKDLNRKAIGIEIEEKYCEIAAKRMEQEVFKFTYQ